MQFPVKLFIHNYLHDGNDLVNINITSPFKEYSVDLDCSPSDDQHGETQYLLRHFFIPYSARFKSKWSLGMSLPACNVDILAVKTGLAR